MLDAQADKLAQVERYDRDEKHQGYRVGHYDYTFISTLEILN